MIKYNPDIHHRRSIRLKGYDYSQKGHYFITICTQNKVGLFGEIENGEIQLNDAGKMILNWYSELANKFHQIRCDSIICMPNHIHFIVTNAEVVGADLCVRPGVCVRPCTPPTDGPDHDRNVRPDNNPNICPDNNPNICPDNNPTDSPDHNQTDRHDRVATVRGDGFFFGGMGKHIHWGHTRGRGRGQTHRSAPTASIGTVVQWFKTMTTNGYIRGVKKYGWAAFPGKLWQRNYWEHIVRSHDELQKIRNYIINNPKNWVNDKLNDGVGNRVMESLEMYNQQSWMI